MYGNHNPSQTTCHRLLIVDDEAAQMKALCDTLGDHDFETFGFTSSRAALESMRTRSYDLLLTDLIMPEMDGIALLRAALEIDHRMVGVMMSGEGTIAKAVEAMKAGALDYIMKPFKLSVILPVLERALAMRRLRRENEVLELSVREHARQLEVANRELESFSYTVSHDLRAPLRAIGMYSGFMIEQCASLAPDVQDLARRVQANTHRMEQLIEGLLGFARLSRQAITKAPVNLDILVRQVVQELREQYPGHPVQLSLDPLPEVLADAGLLHQVVHNLLGNAFKFTARKEAPAIQVGCRQETAEIVVSIRDNGAGFDMRFREKLFGVFQRLHTAAEFEGTGIGLSIVQRIIHRHDGRVWAEGTLGAGATFYFSLPAAKSEALH